MTHWPRPLLHGLSGEGHAHWGWQGLGEGGGHREQRAIDLGLVGGGSTAPPPPTPGRTGQGLWSMAAAHRGSGPWCWSQRPSTLEETQTPKGHDLTEVPEPNRPDPERPDPGPGHSRGFAVRAEGWGSPSEGDNDQAHSGPEQRLLANPGVPCRAGGTELKTWGVSPGSQGKRPRGPPSVGGLSSPPHQRPHGGHQALGGRCRGPKCCPVGALGSPDGNGEPAGAGLPGDRGAVARREGPGGREGERLLRGIQGWPGAPRPRGLAALGSVRC